MIRTKILLTIAVASIFLVDLSALAQSKPATTPPAGSKTVKPGTPPAKVPAKGSATTPAEKKTVSKALSKMLQVLVAPLEEINRRKILGSLTETLMKANLVKTL